jgi:hypothetical protein
LFGRGIHGTGFRLSRRARGLKTKYRHEKAGDCASLRPSKTGTHEVGEL